MIKILLDMAFGHINKSFNTGLTNLSFVEFREITQREHTIVFNNVKILPFNRVRTALTGMVRVFSILLTIFILIPSIIYVILHISAFQSDLVQAGYDYFDFFFFVYVLLGVFSVFTFITLLVKSPYSSNHILRSAKYLSIAERLERQQILSSVAVEPTRVSGAVSFSWKSFENVLLGDTAEVTLIGKKNKSKFLGTSKIPGIQIQFDNNEDARLFFELSKKYIAEIEQNKKFYEDQKEKKLKFKLTEQEQINSILHDRH